MHVHFAMKRAFFDTKLVERALGKARMEALSKAGAFVRKRARSSLRRRKKPSSPGSPPSVHSKDSVASLKTILFAWDSSIDGVIVGPVALNQANDMASGARTTVPALHEHGGTAVILEERWVSTTGRGATPWRRVDRRRRARLRPGWKHEARRRRANYPKRPFMRPALAEEAKHFPDVFKNAFRK